MGTPPTQTPATSRLTPSANARARASSGPSCVAQPEVQRAPRLRVGDLAVGGDEQPGVGLGAQCPAGEWVLGRVENLAA
jgi:hypothetical protein